jgi:hypothetical protein
VEMKVEMKMKSQSKKILKCRGFWLRAVRYDQEGSRKIWKDLEERSIHWFRIIPITIFLIRKVALS